MDVNDYRAMWRRGSGLGGERVQSAAGSFQRKEISMRRSSLALWPLIALALVLWSCSPGYSGPSPVKPTDTSFEGSWKVKVTPDAQAVKAGVSAFDDTLVMHDGVFTAKACVPYGFKSGPYTVSR